MEVVVSSEQIRRIGFNILDKIYGPMKKHYGRFVSDVYVYSNFRSSRKSKPAFFNF